MAPLSVFTRTEFHTGRWHFLFQSTYHDRLGEWKMSNCYHNSCLVKGPGSFSVRLAWNMTARTCWREICVFVCAFKICGARSSDNDGLYKPSREVFCCRAEAGQHEDTPKYLEGKKLWRHPWALLSPGRPDGGKSQHKSTTALRQRAVRVWDHEHGRGLSWHRDYKATWHLPELNSLLLRTQKSMQQAWRKLAVTDFSQSPRSWVSGMLHLHSFIHDILISLGIDRKVTPI